MNNLPQNQYVEVPENVKEFLIAWLSWAENGAKPNYVFLPHSGLCTNSHYYAQSLGMSAFEAYSFKRTVSKLFSLSGLDSFYPFGEAEYDYCSDNRIMHVDKNRLEWVRSAIAGTLKRK